MRLKSRRGERAFTTQGILCKTARCGLCVFDKVVLGLSEYLFKVFICSARVYAAVG